MGNFEKRMHWFILPKGQPSPPPPCKQNFFFKNRLFVVEKGKPSILAKQSNQFIKQLQLKIVGFLCLVTSQRKSSEEEETWAPVCLAFSPAFVSLGDRKGREFLMTQLCGAAGGGCTRNGTFHRPFIRVGKP